MIARSVAVIGCSLIFATAAHGASISVLGANADAIACYRAAESEARRPDAVRTCSAALADREMSIRDTMATHVNRGIVRFRLEDFSGAIADFDAALALEPGQPEALINKGITMLAGGEPIDSAMAMIDRGLQRGPLRPWVGYYGRGVAHELAGRDSQAYRDYRRAQELRPGWQPVEQALSRFTVRG